MKIVLNKIFSIILNILIVFVVFCLVISVYNYVQLNVLNKKYANYFGYTYFNTISGSMEDTINIDDYVFVEITKDVEVDDIVTFCHEDMVITHRVIKMNEDELVTKGDANNIEDNPISKEQVIGKVIYIGRDFGKYIKLITEPIVFVSFFVTVLLFNFAFSGSEKERSALNEKKILKQEAD